jgi:hypothetical protein
MEDCLADPSLMAESVFHPIRKFLVKDGVEDRIIDEPCTADIWWQIEVRHSLSYTCSTAHELCPCRILFHQTVATLSTALPPLLSGSIKETSPKM